MQELGFVNNGETAEKLVRMTVPELMRDFVLPHCLCLPRSGDRYPRISGRYMQLMTKHGRDFLIADYEFGSVLLELAMQRITRHPDLPAIDYREILPEAYKPYSAASVNPNGYNGCPDEPGLWGSTEVHFLTEMLPECLKLRDAKFAGHAKLILFQLLTKLNKGRSGWCGEFMWLEDIRHCDLTQEEVWKAAMDMVFSANLVQEFVDYAVANGWRSGRKVFASPRFYAQDLEYLLSKIDLDKEEYYRGFKRGLLKALGLYDKMTRKRVLAELQSVN